MEESQLRTHSVTHFRVGEFGRFEWNQADEEYYIQYMPPCLQNQTATPEYILAEMDHAGIDMAVLQNPKAYGKLNTYIGRCVAQYPDRFVGLAEVDELNAGNPSEVDRLRDAVERLGLKGIYFEATAFAQAGDPSGFNASSLDPFWDAVSDLRVPVFWSLTGSRMSAHDYMERIRSLSLWLDMHSDIVTVMVHGLFARPFRKEDKVRFPEDLMAFFRRPNVYAEILYPIQVGPLGWEYPFSQARELIRQQVEEIGAQKLIWGSDMPNVLRNCTYRQSLTYVRDWCEFIDPADMSLILGGNIARLLKIQERPSGAPRRRLATIA